MTDLSSRIECRWCKGHNPNTATTCDRCGAPLDARNVVSDSGWRAAPRIRDLTEVKLGASTFQVDGAIVPVAEVDLAPGDSVFFEHHVMLWKDFSVSMSVMSTPGGAKRILAGMPFVVSVGNGPGRISFSRDAPGEIVMLPIDPGAEIDVREHAMLVGSGNLNYSYENMPGLKAALSAGTGMYLDRFVAPESSGLLVLHGYGNVLQRTLGDGETVVAEPGGFLYKDSSVSIEILNQSLVPEGANAGVQAAKGFAKRGLAAIKAARDISKGGGIQAVSGVFSAGNNMALMKLTGPGRVGIQSMYRPAETG